jgi:hypothetical protein
LQEVIIQEEIYAIMVHLDDIENIGLNGWKNGIHIAEGKSNIPVTPLRLTGKKESFESTVMTF